MMVVSAHFTLDEVVHSETATRLRINNTPPDSVMPNVHLAADMMERIRAGLSADAGRDIAIVVSSWYRCLALNRAIGSSDTSDHILGLAVDFKAPGYGSPYKVAQFIARNQVQLGVGQVIHEFGRWVHVSAKRPDKAINAAITIDHDGVRCGICEVLA